MKVVAVVVNWDGGERVLAAVRSLLDQGLAAGEVVVVDNASTDGSPAALEAAHPGLVLLRNDRNEGYGHGTNRGVERGLEDGADAVLLANDDVEFPSTTLASLVARLEARPELGVVGPRVLYANEPTRVWAAGGTLDFRQNLSTLRGHRAPDGPEWQRTLDVDYVAGCAMLVRRAVLERVGLLDGTYFAYHEDVEFCLRAREAGFAVECAGGVAALHDAHASTGGGYGARRKWMMGVNTVWFLRAHGTPGRWLRFVAFDVLPLPVLVVVGLFTGRARGALAKALGTWDGLRGRRVTAETLAPGGSRLW